MNIPEKRKHEAFEWLRQLALLCHKARAEELQNPPIRPWRDRADMMWQLQVRLWWLSEQVCLMDSSWDRDEKRYWELRRRHWAIGKLLERLHCKERSSNDGEGLR